ncbi:hypothetical protein LSUCC0031_12865 [Rhodobacterales bacterium LSUCC0031]|nr:hypothetical protein [Rhodobacterales bacterium LSUCC0031]
MTADPNSRQDQLIAELHRLRGMGLEVVPVSEKQALVPFKDRPSLPTSKIEAFIRDGEATGLGLRLGGLTVIDIDVPDPSWVTKAEARFGKTDVRVRTPSGGIHLYYAGQLDHPPNLKSEGWPVDFKTGRNQYVVTSASWRADGRSYRVEGSAIAAGALPPIRDNEAASTPIRHRQQGAAKSKSSAAPDAVVAVGQRHDYLVGRGKLLARNAKSESELLDALRRVFEAECDKSTPLETGELEGIAEWCWNLQQKGLNFVPGESYVSMPRWVMEALRGNSRAQHLALVIYQLHGGQPGKAFCLDHKGMRDAGWTDLGRDGFRSALGALLNAGVISVQKQYVRAEKKTRFKLSPKPHSL